MFLKIQKFHRKTPVLEPLFNKVAGLEAYFEDHLQTTAPDVIHVNF